jgi:hypothetical protein
LCQKCYDSQKKAELESDEFNDQFYKNQAIIAKERETFKIVISRFERGKFALSAPALEMFRQRKGIANTERPTYADEILRDDPDLVAVVEALGAKASDDRYSALWVVKVPTWLRKKGWYIVDEDGVEHISEEHLTWY